MRACVSERLDIINFVYMKIEIECQQVLWELRAKSDRYFYRSLEHFNMMEMLCDLDLVFIFQLVVQKKQSYAHASG